MSEPDYSDLPPYPFKLKPVAKSSTSVMDDAVCQVCGCKRDGKPLTKPCACICHKGART